MQKHDKLTKIAMDFFNPETLIYKKFHGALKKVFYSIALVFFLQVTYQFLINS
jgi:hypothetical protein